MKKPIYYSLIFNLAVCAANLYFGPTVSNSACYGEAEYVTQFQGIIRAPVFRDWLEELNCTWIIVASVREMVTVRFESFELPCYSGHLTIWAPGQTASTLCNVVRPRPLTFLGGSVHINLRVAYRPRPRFKLAFIKGFLCQAGWTLCGDGDCVPAGFPCSSLPTPTASPAPPSPPPSSCPCPPLRHLSGFFGSFASPDYGPGWPRSRRPPCDCSWRLDAGEARPLLLTFRGLALGPGDRLEVRAEWEEAEAEGGTSAPGRLLARLSSADNPGPGGRPLVLEAPGGVALLWYRSRGGLTPGGFNATYQVEGYCLPWERPCRDGGTLACYSEEQRCDGVWDCRDGSDEENCGRCPVGQYPCGPRGRACYLAAERCDYQASCPQGGSGGGGGGDEVACRTCQPGTFHCADDRCIFETWVCDGQPDCRDGSDERHCRQELPRKVATAAAVGSLVCGLLLVVAMGCTCKLYSLRASQYSLLTPLAHMEAVQRSAPPSYGELIAQGAIPPVEDFPTENPNDTSMMGNLRSILQLLRQDSSHQSTRRHRRNRYLRRLSRRFRRTSLYALLSRSSRVRRRAPEHPPTTTSSSSSDPSAAPSSDPPPARPSSSSSSSSSSLPLPRKFPLLESSGSTLPPSSSSSSASPQAGVPSCQPLSSQGASLGGRQEAEDSPSDPRDVQLLPLSEPDARGLESGDSDEEALLC